MLCGSWNQATADLHPHDKNSSEVESIQVELARHSRKRGSFKIKIKANEPCGSIFPECFLLRSVRAGCIAQGMHAAIAKSFSRDAHAEATAQTILSSPQATN
jgi:hypothetical protein